MDHSHKVKGSYETAYKLSGAIKDTKGMRLKRRSVEQKELRFDEVKKRRNLIDLSPLQESDVTVIKDKSYKDKTPVKTTIDKTKKGADRLEQLKKWKAEREQKKKKESQSKSNVFRVSKNMEYGDQNLFSHGSARHSAKSTTSVLQKTASKSTHKPSAASHTSVSQKEPVDKKREPSTKRPEPAATRTRTRQTSGSSRPSAPASTSKQSSRSLSREPSRPDTRARPKQTKAETTVQSRTTRSGRSIAPAATARVTRQTTNKQAAKPQEKENESPDLSCVTTQRGDNTDNTSFAPPDFAFNASSFVFKPLSPNSAAGFLFGGQDSTCTSFLETNPKRSSTPKRGSRSSQSSSQVEMVTDKCSDTIQLENTAINVTGFINQPVSKNSPVAITQSALVTRTPEPAVGKDEVDAETTIVSQSEDQATDDKPEMKTPVRRTRRSVASSSVLSVSDSKAIEEQEAPKSSTKPRRSIRRTSTSGNSNESEIPLSADEAPSSVRRSRRSCVATIVEETPTAEVTIAKTPKSVLKKQKLSDDQDDAMDTTVSSKTPTSVLRSSRRRSVTINTDADNSQNLVVTPLRSAKKLPSRSVSVSFNPVIEVPEMVAESQDENSAPESDSVFEDEVKVSEAEPMETVTTALPADTKGLKFTDIPETTTPGRKSKRNKSFGGFRLPNTDSLVLSAKRKGRKSMMPKSPEEWVDLLSKSPMVEMTRRRSKIGNTSLPVLSFDVDLNEPNSTVDEVNGSKELMAGSSQSEMGDANSSYSDLGTNHSEVSPAKTSCEKPDTKEERDVTVMDETLPKDMEKEAATVQVEEVSSTQESAEEKHDVPYFRQLLSTETERLSVLSEEWTEINKEAKVSEEIHGQIRTTVGQAQLLMDQRFKQFEGLVDNCEFNLGEKLTTCTDLQGFWDMIFFQVEDVDAKFEDLRKLKANKWIDDKPKPVVKKVKKVSKPVTTKPVVKSKFAAFRKQMQQQQKGGDTPAKTKEEEKVFEVPGFFTVASPVRTPKVHCEGGTPRKCTPVTSTTDASGSGSSSTSLSVPKLNSAELLLRNHTPGRPRPSYLPAVPSPLLTDSTPLPRPTRACTQKTPVPKRLLDVDPIADAPVSSIKKARRSLRVQNASLDTEISDTARTNTEEPCENKTEESLGNKTDVDFARLLQPMAPPQPEAQEPENKLDDSFTKYLQPISALDSQGEKENTPKRTGRRRSSSLKQCPSKEKRRSQSRAVHFSASASDDISHVRLPHTPFNSGSLVKQKRVTRRSVSGTPSRSVEDEEADDVFNIENVDLDKNLQNLQSIGHRDPRPSLLFTPPELKRSPRVSHNVPTAKLISFSP